MNQQQPKMTYEMDREELGNVYVGRNMSDQELLIRQQRAAIKAWDDDDRAEMAACQSRIEVIYQRIRKNENRKDMPRDPLNDIKDRRLRIVGEILRASFESYMTGHSVKPEEPKTPPPSRDDLLTPIRNMPSPPDPKDKWGKAFRTHDSSGRKLDCPTIWPAKQVKRAKGHSAGVNVEAIYFMMRQHERESKDKALWEAFFSGVDTSRMCDAIVEVLLNRKSFRQAVEIMGLKPNGRTVKSVRLGLFAALEAANEHLRAR